MHRFFRSFLVVFVITAISFVPAQTTPQADFCGIKNTAFKDGEVAFKDGEVVVMKVYYRSVGYIGAGEATFSTRLERYNGKPVYHFVGEGRTYSFFDNFFKVRDRYESHYASCKIYKKCR